MYNNLVLGATVAIALASCMTPASNPDRRNPMNEALAITYIDAVVKGDIKTMEELLTDDYRGYGPGIADSVNKVKEIENWKRNMDSLYVSIKYDRYGTLSTRVDSGRVAGDWVFDWARITLNYKSVEPPVTFWSHAVFRIKDGKINLSRVFYDRHDILRQRGYKLTPPTSTMN